VTWAYLLHLIGYNIFMDKSATYIIVSWLNKFVDLQSCGRFSWGAVALAHLYKKFDNVSLAHTRQLAEYLTLLQVQFIFICFFHVYYLIVEILLHLFVELDI